MKKPKILILIMSCNKDFFKREENTLRDTYLKRLEKYDNIDYYIYTSKENKEDKNSNHVIYLNVPDDFNGTWEKTYQCFKYITGMKKEYDYVIKTNTSTYINVDLLENLIQYMFNIKNNHILSCDYVRTPKFGFGCSGNATIFRWIDIKDIVNNYISIEDFKKNNNINDNSYIGDDIIINSILFKDLDSPNKILDKFALIKGVYYKDESKKNHIYSVEEENLELLKDSLFITFRKHNLNNLNDREDYSYRLEEIEECKRIDKLFDNYKYSPYDVINCLNKYCYKEISYFDLNTFSYLTLKEINIFKNGVQ